MPECYMTIARAITKFPNFTWYLPENGQSFMKVARTIFLWKLGGGVTCPPCHPPPPPSPTPMPKFLYGTSNSGPMCYYLMHSDCWDTEWSFCPAFIVSLITAIMFSGVPRILEWEGSRCHRSRGGWDVGRGCPSLVGKGLGRGLCPSPENVSYFCWKYHILTHSDTFIS